VDFAVDSGRIHYSLAALKAVGTQAIEHIVEARGDRPFTSLSDFANRINPRQVNKRVLESLAAAGAFDALERNRARVNAGLDAILAQAARVTDGAAMGQNELFGGPGEEDTLRLPKAEDWMPAERLQREHAAVGFYLSAHPLDDYAPILKRQRVQTWAEFGESVRGGATAGRLAGTVTGRQERRTRTGGRMGIVQLSDPTGQFEAVIFSETLGQYRDQLEVGQSVVVMVNAEQRPEGVSIRIQSVEPLDRMTDSLRKLRVFLRDEAPLAHVGKHLKAKGEGEVSFVVVGEEGRREVEVRLPGKFVVSPQLAGALRTLDGVEQVELV
jgi:DNA polymerase-3 subunit alpha